MKNKLIAATWLLTGILFPGLHLYSQVLQVGNEIPGIKVPVSNYKSSYLDFNSLKGKTIILDFWSHVCSNCLAAFPEVEQLQEKFNDQIQFILVNQESAERTQQFFALHKKIKRPNLPMIIGDTTLSRLFPHDAVPYTIWIDPNGIIRYTTTGYHLTETNLSRFIRGDFFAADNYGKHRFRNSIIDSNLLSTVGYFSSINLSSDSLRLNYLKQKGRSQLVFNHCSVEELYIKAYDEGGKYGLEFNGVITPGRVILDIADKENLTKPSNPSLIYQWEKKNCFNYQLFAPEIKRDEIYSYMQADLERFFNLKAKFEWRDLSCLELLNTGMRNPLATKGGSSSFSLYQVNIQSTQFDSLRCIINRPYTEFSLTLKMYLEKNFKLPFIDHSGISGNIDFFIPGNIIDNAKFEDLQQYFEDKGLRLIKTTCPVKVLILSK